MKWLDCTNMPEPQAGSSTTPWSGSMTFTMVCTNVSFTLKKANRLGVGHYFRSEAALDHDVRTRG